MHLRFFPTAKPRPTVIIPATSSAAKQNISQILAARLTRYQFHLVPSPNVRFGSEADIQASQKILGLTPTVVGSNVSPLTHHIGNRQACMGSEILHFNDAISMICISGSDKRWYRAVRPTAARPYD
jgi:hypothetical protein